MRALSIPCTPTQLLALKEGTGKDIMADQGVRGMHLCSRWESGCAFSVAVNEHPVDDFKVFILTLF